MKLQQEHYNKIIEDYERHYNDKYSRRYSWKFFYEPLFEGVDLRGKKVLDAMCGGGEMTSFLLSRGAIVFGLDISDEACKIYKKNYPLVNAINCDIEKIPVFDGEFDVVVVAGGLHHTPPRLYEVMEEIRRILKGRGDFFFIEPHKSFLYSKLRNGWYKKDTMFGENEEDIDLKELEFLGYDDYEFIKKKFVGNIAYFLVLNSLIFRVPLWLKPFYSSILIFIETLFNPFMFKWNSAAVLCHWRKK